MTLQEFERLSEMSKIELLYEQGVYIGKLKSLPLTTLLYQLDGFYVEVVYQKHRYHVEGIYGFDSTDRIEPYLENIDIGIVV